MPYSRPRTREFLQVSEGTRRSMSANKSKDTKLEIKFRKALWASGLRGYRNNVKKLPGTPDVVFGRSKLAVFVNGCFWHACPLCGHFTYPKKNADYWREKIEANRKRDAETAARLTELGYVVLSIWECEIKNDIGATVERVKQIVHSPRS